MSDTSRTRRRPPPPTDPFVPHPADYMEGDEPREGSSDGGGQDAREAFLERDDVHSRIERIKESEKAARSAELRIMQEHHNQLFHALAQLEEIMSRFPEVRHASERENEGPTRDEEGQGSESIPSVAPSSSGERVRDLWQSIRELFDPRTNPDVETVVQDQGIVHIEAIKNVMTQAGLAMIRTINTDPVTADLLSQAMVWGISRFQVHYGWLKEQRHARSRESEAT